MAAEQSEPKCEYDPRQHAMLIYCSYKGDSFFWNEWRRKNPKEKIRLEGAKLERLHLESIELNDIEVQIDRTHNYPKCNESLSSVFLNGVSFAFSNLDRGKFMYTRISNISFTDTDMMKANFHGSKLNGATFFKTKLKRASFYGTTLITTEFNLAKLHHAKFEHAQIINSNIYRCWLESANFSFSVFDSKTIIQRCSFNAKTFFATDALNSARIEPMLREGLKNSNRRIHWQNWINEKKEEGGQSRVVAWSVWGFWQASDYGSSTKRIIKTFFWLALGFGFLYWLFAMIPGSQSIIEELHHIDNADTIRPPLTFGRAHTFFRSLYFSIVTMTTLGFGDMHAAKTGGWPSYLGYLLLSVQVIIGYVLLAALVTRIGILFTSEAPAAKPTPMEKRGKFETMNHRIKKWWQWFWSFDERPIFQNEKDRSIIMIGVGWLFWIMRRLSLEENLKRYKYYDPGNLPFTAPANFTDYYILIEIAVVFILSIFFSRAIQNFCYIGNLIASGLLIWISIQTCQTNLFHLIWKTVLEKGFHGPAHNFVRNLIFAIIGYLKIAWFFGIVYWWSFSKSFDKNGLMGLGDAIYFSLITSTTLGFGDITPNKIKYVLSLKMIIVLELIISISMFGVIVARSISLIDRIKDSKTGRSGGAGA